MILRFLIAIFLLLPLYPYCQIDPKKLDSFARAVDSSANVHRQWQDSFAQRQDSIYRSSLRVNTGPNQLANEEKQGEEERKKVFIPLVLGVLFFIGLIVFLIRRKRSKA